MQYSETFLLFLLAVAVSSEPQFQSQTFQNQNGFQNNLFNHVPDDLRRERFFFFDIDLFKAIADHQPEGNILISPLSIKSVLAMVLEGSEGETADEIRDALRLQNTLGIPEQFHKLLAVFQQPQGKVELKMANRIFATHDYNIVDMYRDKIRKYYFADIDRLDTNNPSSIARTINDWVRQETQNTIPNLIEEGDAKDIKILLANALYFKGQWYKKFSEYGTRNNCFYRSNDVCQMTPMMDVQDKFKYDEIEDLNAKVVEIPYAGQEYSMVVILPNNRHGIRQLQHDIRNSIDSIVRNLNETEVFITLPRFKINYNLDLVSYLPKVQIRRMQSNKAQITGITVNIPTRVSNLLHKTFMEVNEEGTVASAATGVVVIPLMTPSNPRFKADHPFLFFIRHIPTGTILFEGRVMEPEVANSQPNQQPNQTPQRKPNPQPQQNPNVHPQQNPNFQPQQNPNLQPQQNPNFQSQQNPNFQPQQNSNQQQNVNTQKRPQQVIPPLLRPLQFNQENNFPEQSSGFSNQQQPLQPIQPAQTVPHQPQIQPVPMTNFPLQYNEKQRPEPFGSPQRPQTLSQANFAQDQNYYQTQRQQLHQQHADNLRPQSDDPNANGLANGQDNDNINFPDSTNRSN